jgi:hypothetical protein
MRSRDIRHLPAGPAPSAATIKVGWFSWQVAFNSCLAKILADITRNHKDSATTTPNCRSLLTVLHLAVSPLQRPLNVLFYEPQWAQSLPSCTRYPLALFFGTAHHAIPAGKPLFPYPTAPARSFIFLACVNHTTYCLCMPWRFCRCGEYSVLCPLLQHLH